MKSGFLTAGLAFLVSVSAVSGAQAQDVGTLCKLRTAHIPGVNAGGAYPGVANGDAAYKPSVDAQGRPVVPADVPNAVPVGVPTKVTVPVTIDLLRGLSNVPAPAGTEMQGTFALVDIYGDGRVSYNGQDITAHTVALCDRTAAATQAPRPVTPVAAAPVAAPVTQQPQATTSAPETVAPTAPSAPSAPSMPTTATSTAPAAPTAPAVTTPSAPSASAPAVTTEAPAGVAPAVPAETLPVPVESLQAPSLPEVTDAPALPPASDLAPSAPSLPSDAAPVPDLIRPETQSQQFEQDELIWDRQAQ